MLFHSQGCSATYTSVSGLKAHLGSCDKGKYAGSKYTCLLCNKQFGSESGVKYHITHTHGQNWFKEMTNKPKKSTERAAPSQPVLTRKDGRLRQLAPLPYDDSEEVDFATSALTETASVPEEGEIIDVQGHSLVEREVILGGDGEIIKTDDCEVGAIGNVTLVTLGVIDDGSDELNPVELNAEEVVLRVEEAVEIKSEIVHETRDPIAIKKRSHWRQV
uniref:C2H2-type domain-containing protein n=1 Tax=Eptatretus burgeri TaxID=7764 RepID=A0A8C4Q5H2_EPTBU